jgi:hypothetical protein
VKKALSKTRHYKYKNLTLLLLGLVVGIFLYGYEPFHTFLLSFGSLGYIGAFVAGALFVLSFTAATGIVILLVLAEQLHPIEVTIVAGLGAVFGDVVIFRFVRDELVKEVSPIFKRFGGKHLTTLLHTKYFSWTLPFIGAIIIASPFPDEIGISLLGISKMTTVKFLILTFVLNSIGISFIISLSPVLQP